MHNRWRAPRRVDSFPHHRRRTSEDPRGRPEHPTARDARTSASRERGAMTTPANMSWLDNFKANAAQATAAVTTGARAVGQTISERSKEAMKEAQAVVAANVQSTSDAAAANLRASAREDTAARATATASDVASAVDYIRIPKASAAKLRLLDKGDVAAMEAAHAEERAALIAECATARAALREALGEDAHQPDDLDRVHDGTRRRPRHRRPGRRPRSVAFLVADVAAETDDGVARVLLHAARAQLEELAARVRELEDPTVSRVADDVASELASLRRGGFASRGGGRLGRAFGRDGGSGGDARSPSRGG